MALFETRWAGATVVGPCGYDAMPLKASQNHTFVAHQSGRALVFHLISSHSITARHQSH